MSLRDAANRRYPDYLDRLGRLVAVDSGSGSLAGLDKAAGLLADWCATAGLSVHRIPVRDPENVLMGDAVVATATGTGTRRILLAGHLDTVFPDGAAATRPFRIDGDRAYGPGVCDDKGGVLAGLAAIETLLSAQRTDFGQLVLVATPDEEIGSPGSRALINRMARGAGAVLCLECARENGDLVRARKGVADIRLILHGRAAHAGIEPERGAHAALAAARLTVALQELNGRWPAVTVNVGVLRSGERPNVVPEQAELVIDLRADEPRAFSAALDVIRELAQGPVVPGVTASVAVVTPTPPWAGSPATDRLVALARQVGAAIDVPVRAVATGGCADANLFAAAGAPVLDGLGPIGGDDHSTAEWLDLSSVVPRVALLAGLVDALSDPDV